LEKKKEKQQMQGLRPEDADADDELSAAGGRRPSKSKSIGEMISRVRRGAPEMKRSKSDRGENSETGRTDTQES
jgi:serine/threonine-protein kinase RIM15